MLLPCKEASTISADGSIEKPLAATSQNLDLVISFSVVGSLVVLLVLFTVILSARRRYLNQNTSSTDKEYWKVIQKHNVSYVDEIDLNIGDIVIIQAKFDDGWAFGTNITTECNGSFPLNCLTELEDPDISESKNGKARASSIVKVLKMEEE